MTPADYVDELRRLGLAAGLDAVGVASAEPFSVARGILTERKAAGLHGSLHFTYGNPTRATDPSRALPGAQALVVGARSYRRRARRPAPANHARIARYAWSDHYRPLREALDQVARRLNADGWRARVLADDNALVDREAATRAGLGWYGKNTNVLLPGRGSWFVLGSVITDAPLPAAAERMADGCGPCRRCLPACPTGALVAPGVLDARRCLAALVQAPGPFPVEYRVALGDRLYGCDDCQDVCPPNLAADRAGPPPPAGNRDEPWVPVLELLSHTDDELLVRFGRWYIPRRQPRYLRRNALVVLGNVADGSDPAVVAALRRAVADADPLVRAHALWAAHRLGRTDLVDDALARERDPSVLADVRAWAGPAGPGGHKQGPAGPGGHKQGPAGPGGHAGPVMHLLVTNDFPPKLGGIQSYLWELWRRLPAEEFAVLTTSYDGARAFDAQQPFRVERTAERLLLPRRSLVRRIDRLAAEVDAALVVLDPALPLGLVGSRLERPYGVVVHGAEVTVPGRLPGPAALLGRVLRGANQVIAAGRYPAAEAQRAAGRELPLTIVPPGVDVERFRPLDANRRRAARERLGLAADGLLVVGVSRLVPRKGFDVLIEAAARLAVAYPSLEVAVAGAGRDRRRLARMATRRQAPVRFLGRVADADMPALSACGDVFAMACRTRWAGLEQEGFGIVFLEAAACGVPQVAGDSGGAADAVVDGETGLVVRRPERPDDLAVALSRLLDDQPLRARLGAATRTRAESVFAYDVLARRLHAALQATTRS